MAKKVVTPEEYKAKQEKKIEKRKKFGAVFTKALAFGLAFVMVYSATVIAYKKTNSVGAVGAASAGTAEPTTEQVGAFDNVEEGEGGATGENGEPGAEETILTSINIQYDTFVTAFKGVKTEAKSVTCTKKNGSNYKGIAEAGMLSSVLQSLMSSLLKEEVPENATYSGADIKANFPPAGYDCGLTKDDVKEISCREEGNYYIITITVKDEVNPEFGKGAGSIASVLTKQSITDPIKDIPGLNSLEPTCAYENVKCEAKIDKTTMKMVEYYYCMPLILSFEKQGYKVGLQFEEWWSIKY